jgi:hypothetical protein
MRIVNAIQLSLVATLAAPVSSFSATTYFDSNTIIMNEILPDGSIDGDANGDGSIDATEDEFIELVNVSSGSIDISGYSIWVPDFGTARHTFPPGTIIDSYGAIVIFGGGTPTGFTGIQTQTAANADAGIQYGLALDDTSDRITLRDASNNIVFDIEYNSAIDSIADQSLTRSPDLTGSYIGHQLASGGLFSMSPGTFIDGSPITSPVPSEEPDIFVNPAAISFGDVLIGYNSVSELTISNEGTADLTIGLAGDSNGLTSPFSFGIDNCSNSIVAPENSCTIEINFQPLTTGAFNDSFNIPSDDPDTPDVTVQLSGTGIQEAGIGGTANGIWIKSVNCYNKTTRQKVKIAINGAESTWDCESAGLEVNPGDQIDMTVKGFSN